ncbi:MAG: hypothetical protein R6X20_08220 [Phycisphaerae bacterium]
MGVTGNPQVESVAVSQCRGHGVYTRGTKSGKFVGCAFLGANNWKNGGHGFLQAEIGPNRAVLPLFIDCAFSGNEGDGIHQIYDAAGATALF